MTSQTVPEGLKAFVHLGLLAREEAVYVTGTNHQMECPLCSGQKSLGVSLVERTSPDGRTVSPGLWNCFKCGESGNTVSLLQKVYETYRANLSLARLANDRGLPESILHDYGIIPAPFNGDGCYWVPIANLDGHIINIYRYDLALKAEKSKYAFIGCPGCTAGLFNAQSLKMPPPGCDLTAKELDKERHEYPVFVAEGHWDTIAWDHVVRACGERSRCDIVGIPGANSFSNSWFKLLKGRKLYLMYDHDPPREINGKTVQPGWDGINRTIKLARRERENRPQQVKVYEWKS